MARVVLNIPKPKFLSINEKEIGPVKAALVHKLLVLVSIFNKLDWRSFDWIYFNAEYARESILKLRARIEVCFCKCKKCWVRKKNRIPLVICRVVSSKSRSRRQYNFRIYQSRFFWCCKGIKIGERKNYKKNPLKTWFHI